MLSLISKFTKSLVIILLIASIAHSIKVDEALNEYIEIADENGEELSPDGSSSSPESTPSTSYTEADTSSSNPSTDNIEETTLPDNETTSGTDVPSTEAPKTFVIYVRMTVEEFRKVEDQFKEILVKVLNGASDNPGESQFHILFGAYAGITASDIEISYKQLDNGILKLDITVRNTKMSGKEAEAIVIKRKAEFSKVVVIVESPTEPTSSGGLKDWEIALIVIGTVMGVIILAAGTHYYRKRRRRIYENNIELNKYGIN